MKWWTRAILGAGAVVSVTACSVMTSLDGLSDGSGSLAAGNPGAGSGGNGGGSDASGRSDGAASSGGDDGSGGGAGDDASGTTGGDDASGSPGTDGGGGSDAGLVDAGKDSGAATGYCALLSPKPLFCDDFDESALAAPWNQLTNKNASPVLSTASSVSAPESMLVTTVSGSPSVDGAGYKTFAKLTSTATLLTLAFDLRVEQADTSNNSDAVLGAIQFFDAAGDLWDLQLEAFWDSSSNKLGLVLSEDGEPGDGGPNQYFGHTANTELALNTWAHVTLQLSLATPLAANGPGTASLSLGGAVVASATTLHVATTSPTPEILVGITYVTSGNTGWTARYDNVTYSSAP